MSDISIGREDVPPPFSMWGAIADAYAFVLAGKAKRLDGDGWSVYAVGSNLIRVDVRLP